MQSFGFAPRDVIYSRTFDILALPARYMVRPWCAVLVLISMLLPGSASASIPQGINFRTENNSSAVAISSAKSPMPTALRTLTATVWYNSDPWPGKTVYFSIVSGVGVYLPFSSGTTDGNGQVMIVVRGTGLEGSTGVTVVKAKYYDAVNSEHSSTVTITSITESTVPSDSPINKAPFASGTSIRWVDHTAEMSSYESNARASCTVANHIGFIAGGPPNIDYFDYDDVNDGSMAYTDTQGSYRATYFNGINLGASRWLGISSNCPLGWRHHVNNTACHELCHALLLGENGADRKALMWGDPENYWIWTTEQPIVMATHTGDDWNPLLSVCAY